MTFSAMPNRRLLVALFVVWGLALASYAYVGSHSRMIADDYCTADVGIRYGSIGGVRYDYETWDGSVTNSILKSWLAPLQPQFHHVQTLLFIGALALASLAVLSALAPASSWWVRGAGTLFFTFLACYSSLTRAICTGLLPSSPIRSRSCGFWAWGRSRCGA